MTATRAVVMCLLLVLFASNNAFGDESARLSTSEDGLSSGIPAADLKAWLDSLLPTETKRLLIFGQCYGGNFVSQFATDTNTVVFSATEKGHRIFHDGYTSGIPGALMTDGGAGKTAEDFHKKASEKKKGQPPQTGGGLPPTDFSLAPLGTEVKSRHILIYAGIPEIPDVGPTDKAKRDKIKKNFPPIPGQQSVISVGGDASRAPGSEDSGIDGWDHPGTPAGLKSAIRKLADEIKAKPEADRAKEQFILVVFDHGSANSSADVINLDQVIESQLGMPEADREELEEDPTNIPFGSFEMRSSGLNHPAPHSGQYEPFFQPGDWEMEVIVENTGQSFAFTDFRELPYEVNGSGVIGDDPDERLVITFPMDESLFLGPLWNTPLTMRLFNRTAGTPREGDYDFFRANLETGNVAPFIPEPSALALVTVGLLWTTIWRSRRKNHRP